MDIAADHSEQLVRARARLVAETRGWTPDQRAKFRAHCAVAVKMRCGENASFDGTVPPLDLMSEEIRQVLVAVYPDSGLPRYEALGVGPVRVDR